ncbi:MAG: threonine synthase [Hyphomicrobiales bacterium]
MRYISTRQCAEEVGLGRAVLDGIAPDGGLYVPTSVPFFDTQELTDLSNAKIDEFAFAILKRFVGDEVSDTALIRMITEAYASFKHPSVAPLVEVGHDRWIMELFHGPTLAFKDLALQILAPLMDHFLKVDDRDAFILCATSGDTGGAALSAFSKVERVKALVLYPSGGVSEFQENQMLNLASKGCRTVAVDGTFDTCQRLVKSLLSNQRIADRFGLVAVNSVNWGRIMAQSVYFAKASLALGTSERPVNFVVPTGNFGNAYAGVLAKRMGFPVGRITVATNENDTLHRAIDSGLFEPKSTRATNTPAMDIQSPSNFERIVFDADPSTRKKESLQFIEAVKRDGSAAVPATALEAIRKDIVTKAISTIETDRQIKETYEQSGYVADPHTAVGLAAAKQTGADNEPTIVFATAHPVKFSKTVDAALERELGITAYHGECFDRQSDTRILEATEEDVVKLAVEIFSGQGRV